MQIQVGEGTYFVVSFMDEYSRYLVHFESATGMHGITVSTGAQAAIDALPKGEDGKPVRSRRSARTTAAVIFPRSARWC
jgi:hypothetical protein